MSRGWLIAVVLLLAGSVALGVAGGNEAPRMSKEELKAGLGSPGLVVIDVRRGADWERSPLKIAGAVREDPEAVEEWAGKYDRRMELVLYCA